MAASAPPPSSALDQQEYRLAPWGSLQLHPANPRRGNVAHIVENIRVNGWFGACGVQRSSGLLIWGNHRYLAGDQASRLIERARSGAWKPMDEAEQEIVRSWAEWPERFGGELSACPVFDIDCDDERALDILLSDNAASDAAEYDRPGLAELLSDIEERRGSLEGTGFSRPELDALMRDADQAAELGGGGGDTTKLADRFLVPPFSVLDARQGYWQDRKRSWLALGIRSELGRPRNLLKFSETVLDAQRPDGIMIRGRQPVGSGSGDEGAIRMGIRPPNRSKPSDSGNDPQFYWKKQEAEKRAGRALSTEEFLVEFYEGPDAYVEGTSIFDPVLAELAYRWWSPEGAVVFDPFAGGSVRGIVASRLGRRYIGVDLSAPQIAANEEQAREIVRPDDPEPVWLQGDARDVESPDEVDFVFSCPPYFNLERYSDNESDLSNCGSWELFCEALEQSVDTACAQLRPGRFACFVVGNVREETTDGAVLDLQAATVRAFARAGLVFYNDAVLVTAIGSLAIRAARIFRTRKLGRTHQTVLTFLKPPLDQALAACGPIEVADPAEAFGEPL